MNNDLERIYVTKSSMPPFEEYVDEIKTIWETHWLTNMGPLHNQLEEMLKNYLGINYISLFTNGHSALEMTLQAFDLKGEVITTPFTFASTTHAIVRNGLTPVFCDIREDDYTIDASKIESLITENTSAILPVHVYGNMCDVYAIQRIAEKYGLKVIYDAAHAFGVKYFDKSSASFGDASMFSFHATKVFNTIEGGAVTFNHSALEKKLYELKNFGIKDTETVNAVGGNAKMNEFQAAMGICNLKHIDNAIEKRKKLVNRYRTLLKNCKGLKIQVEKENVLSNYAYFPIQIDSKNFGESRDAVYFRLQKSNIMTRKYFYPLISDFDCYKNRYNSSDTPVAKKIADEILCLPLYEDLTLEQVEFICTTLLDNRR